MSKQIISATRVALLGCGRIAQRFHLPVLTSLQGVELSAVAELEIDARDAARSFAPRTSLFSDYQSLLASSQLDAAVICLPPALHADAALACFEQGLHVYLEKPLATTSEDGERVVAAWKRAGTTGVVGFNCRFHPLVTELRTTIRSEILGELVGAQATFSSSPRALPKWKRCRDSGGGALLDLASHQFDLARFVFEREFTEVNAFLRSVSSEDDTAVVEARLSDGALITFFLSLVAIEEDRMEVVGSRGKIVFDRYRSSRLNFIPSARDFSKNARAKAAMRAIAAAPRALRDLVFPPREQSFTAALGAFIAAIRGADSVAADLNDGLKSLKLVAAAEEAARRGETVVLARGDSTVLPISPASSLGRQAVRSRT